jgi:transposase
MKLAVAASSPTPTGIGSVGAHDMVLCPLGAPRRRDRKGCFSTCGRSAQPFRGDYPSNLPEGVLQYDGQGFWLATKRLSKGRFQWWPTGSEGVRTLRAHQAQLLLAAGNPDADAPPAWRPSANSNPCPATPQTNGAVAHGGSCRPCAVSPMAVTTVRVTLVDFLMETSLFCTKVHTPLSPAITSEGFEPDRS